MKLFLSLITLMTLTACSSAPPQTAWLTPEMQKIKAKCEYEIALAKIKKAEQPAMMNACMAAQGYQNQGSSSVNTSSSSSGSGVGSYIMKSVINEVLAQ